jgi:hypothetical protein
MTRTKGFISEASHSTCRRAIAPLAAQRDLDRDDLPGIRSLRLSRVLQGQSQALSVKDNDQAVEHITARQDVIAIGCDARDERNIEPFDWHLHIRPGAGAGPRRRRH